MLMYLMDGRKLLNLSLQKLFFRGFLKFLFLFTILYILGVKKHTLFCKKDSQFDRRKRQAIKEEKELFFVCYILDIYYSLNRHKFRLLFM